MMPDPGEWALTAFLGASAAMGYESLRFSPQAVARTVDLPEAMIRKTLTAWVRSRKIRRKGGDWYEAVFDDPAPHPYLLDAPEMFYQ